MARLYSQPICVASGLLVPLISLAAPSWLSLGGVLPSWAVLWLLPWALVDGPVSGVIAGAAMGLVLDGLSVGDASQVPALMLLGWWWGRLGRAGTTDSTQSQFGVAGLDRHDAAWAESLGAAAGSGCGCSSGPSLCTTHLFGARADDGPDGPDDWVLATSDLATAHSRMIQHTSHRPRSYPADGSPWRLSARRC